MIIFERLQLVAEIIATGYLLDDIYFKKHYTFIAIELENNVTIFSIIEEAKYTVLDFLIGTFKVLWFCFVLI